MSDASNRQIAVYSVFVGRHAEHREYFLTCQYGLLQSRQQIMVGGVIIEYVV